MRLCPEILHIDIVLSNTTTQEWIEYTRENIQNTSKELNSAKPLRSYIDIILKQVVEDLSNQVGRTNEAFEKRITETRYAKTVLEDIHNQTARKVNDMCRNITNLEKELAEKEGYVSLCQSRLANRAQRPGIELCQDNVQKTLIDELTSLRATVGSLSQMLTQVNRKEQATVLLNLLETFSFNRQSLHNVTFCTLR